VGEPSKGLSGTFFYYFTSAEAFTSGLVSFGNGDSFELLMIEAYFISCGGPKKLPNIAFVSTSFFGYTLGATS
jgi:hypothetical protein